MKKRRVLVVFLIILGLFLIGSVFAVSSVDSEMQKITHYAEEYEIGNINYVKLLVYISESRQNLNEILGATEKEMGGILKQEKIKEILGEPIEETKWVWVEGEEQDKKIDSPAPVWKKVIFDGKKIQIRLNAWPSIFSKKEFSEGKGDKQKALEDLEGKLIYRLNFEIEFKRPEEQMDIAGKIEEIKSLAETFSSNPTQTNAEDLAEESVNAEKKFESYFRQSSGKCEDLMVSVFGSENQMPVQSMVVQEISFYEGENFEIIARLELCDECEWNWINLDLWAETRGHMPKIDESGEVISPEQFKNKDDKYYKSEIINLLNSYEKSAEEKNWKEANKIKQKLWMINEAWNQKSNEVWKEIEQKSDVQGWTVVENKISEEDNQNKDAVENRERQTSNNNVVENLIENNKLDENNIVENIITGNVINGNNNDNKQLKENNDPYFWIKQDQERRKREKELRKQNYEERKQFYLNLFSAYDKKEYSFAQVEFKKRLIELFREKGEEICDNNLDDNQNEKIDCDDELCGGKICGRGIISVIDGNETKETETDFYCIAGECKAKEQIVKIKETVCGDHNCEENENVENCAEDCSVCPQYSAVECSGKVIFKGKDAKGCPLEPTCIEEQVCRADEDCRFLCGIGECIEGKCKVKELSECSEEECTDGMQKTMSCELGESVVSSICANGLWTGTGIGCSGAAEQIEEVIIEDIVGNACTTRADCGGENDVCSNGKCVSIPENIEVEEHEIEVEEPPTQETIEGDEEQGEEQFARETEAEETWQDAETEQTSESQETLESPEPEVIEQNSEQTETMTGNVIFSIKKITGKITGFAIGMTGFDVEENIGDNVKEKVEEEAKTNDDEIIEKGNLDESGEPGPSQEQNTDSEDDLDNYENGDTERQDEWREEERRETEERERYEEDERRNEENKKRCKEDCNRPCIEKCIRENCGENLECSIDKESKKCEVNCRPDDSCVEKCMKGEEDWWKEFENKKEFKEQKGGFEAGGNCRTAKGKTEGFIWFGGWGDPFEKIQPLKNKYYFGGNAEWCKFELQNLIRQREEFEKGFNQKFVKWFFEDYLANSAENWEQAISGIFELYWKNVDNQREIAFRMKCLDENDINQIMGYNLIDVSYEAEYGKIEYWEEAKQVKIPGMEGEATIISPYMKIWIFPPKEFIVYEMKKAMKNHEFPGSPEDKLERKNEEGLTSQEKEMVKQDKKFMEMIGTIAEKYGGSLDVVIQFKDLTSNEVIFNLYAQVNENEIIKMTPMLPEEVPSKDVTAEVDFEKIYELIYSQEKEMRGEMVESPPWDRKIQPTQKIKEVVNGVKMYFKVRDIMNSAKITPVESEKDVKNLFKKFMSMMMKGEKEKRIEENVDKEVDSGGEEKGVWESKEAITGQVIG